MHAGLRIAAILAIPVFVVGVNVWEVLSRAQRPAHFSSRLTVTTADAAPIPVFACSLLPPGLPFGDGVPTSLPWGVENERSFVLTVSEYPAALDQADCGTLLFIKAPGFEPLESGLFASPIESPHRLIPSTRSSLMATGPVTDASAHPLDLKPEHLRLWVRTPSGTFVPLPWGWGVTFSGGYVSTTALLVGDIFSIEAQHPVHGQGLLNPVELLPNEHNFLPPLVLSAAHRLVIRGGLAKPEVP